MSAFEASVRQDTPRLVVQFQRTADGGEAFQWGVVGSIPILNLLGGITCAQALLVNDTRAIDECPQSALVIAWDEEARAMLYFVHPDIPSEPLVGMLETIKAAIISSRMAQAAAANRVQLAQPRRNGIVGPDGQPYNGGR